MDITFAQTKLTDQFKVVNVKKGILPPRTNYSIDVPSKHGSYYAGFKYNPRTFSVDIVIVNNDINSVMRTIAWMLDLSEPSELIFSDEPDKLYYAVVDGSTDIESILTVGTGTITFVCFDPFAYSTESSNFTPDSNGLIVVNNGGTAPASPQFEVDFTSDCGYVAFISPNGVIQVGNPQEVDGLAVPLSERLITDQMTTTTGWTVNTYGKVRTSGAVIQGTVTHDSYFVYPSSYGTQPSGTVWYGSTIRKDIGVTADQTNSAQYWEASMDFQFVSTANLGATAQNKQMGKIEFNVMDTNNNFLAGFTLADMLAGYQANTPEFYVGTTKIWSESAAIPAPTKVKQYNSTTKKYEYKTVQSTNAGKWNNFVGKIIIRKTGSLFSFDLQKIESGKITQRVTKMFYDMSGIYTNVNAKTVQVWFGKYSSYPQMGTNRVDTITFRKDNIGTWKDLPNLFGSGDKLIIDCDASQVYLNGALFMDVVDIGSTFFDLIEGQTEVQFLHSSFGTTPTVTATITNKFL